MPELIYTSGKAILEKKQDVLLLPITLRNVDHFKILSVGLGSKQVMKRSLKIPPHLKLVATLPCEM